MLKKIAIFGVPRSGTSWLSQIFNSHQSVVSRFQPLFSYEHKGKLSERSTNREINTFFDEILNSHDDFALMKADVQKDFPKFKKSSTPTHLVFKETRYLHIVENLIRQSKDIKIVGIVRNPLATLASWINAPKEFKTEWSIIDEWYFAPSKNMNKKEEYFGYNQWKLTAESFLKFKEIYPDQFLLVQYSKLNINPVEEIQTIFNFCDLEICQQVIDFIRQSKSIHSDDPYSVYRGNANDNNWREILPDEIIETVKNELQNTPLDIFLENKNA